MQRTVMLLLAFAACSSKEGGAGATNDEARSCPAFEVKVDGTPLTGLTTKMAFTHKKGEDRTHQVQFFNHDKVTCADLTSRKGRIVADGEVTIGAFTGGHGAFGRGVMTSAYTELGVDVALVGEPPGKEGDKVALCVAEKTFKPNGGEWKDKPVTIKGLMEGTWCGFMDWDAK